MAIIEQSQSNPNVFRPNNDKDSQPRHSLLKKVTAGVGATLVGALAAGGGYLMFRNNNMDDFSDLRTFTSPSHQEARCDMQNAFDAQEQMRQHFEDMGGVPEDQVPVVSGFVGLEDAQVKQLLETELFDMDFDCHVPTASSQEATTGLVMVTAAAGLAVGAAGGLTLARKKE